MMNKPLLVIGTVVLLVGAFLALFGTVYFITFDAPTNTPSLYLCPIWSNYVSPFNMATCIRLTGPSPYSHVVVVGDTPTISYLSYIPNFIGIVLIFVGAVLMVKSRRSTERTITTKGGTVN